MSISFDFRLWLESQGRDFVLVAIGAYNPIHRGHIRALYNAKRYLQVDKGMNIVNAYMVPKHQSYVEEKSIKKGEPVVSLKDRLDAISLALKGTFIKLLTIDCDSPKPLSDQEIKTKVQQIHPEYRVIMVVGDDYVKCPGNASPPCLIDVPNYGEEFINPRGRDNFSSTAVKKALAKGEETPMLAPQVYNYARSKHIWGA